MENNVSTAAMQQKQAVSGLTKFNRAISADKTQEYLASVLGERKGSFVNNVTALVTNNAMLQDCEPMPLMFTALKATALELPLDPNLGFAYIIPYKNGRTGKTDPQFQIGYKGFIQLAIRSGQFEDINVRDVRDGEIIGEDFLSGKLQFRMLRENRKQAKVIGYVSYFKLLNGFSKMAYWTVEELYQHAGKYSQTYSADKRYGKKSSRWSIDFDAMARKTALKLLISKYAPLSVEMQNAIKYDQATVINENGDARYVDNQEQAMSGDERLDEIARKEAEMEAQQAYEEAEVVEETADEAKDNLFD